MSLPILPASVTYGKLVETELAVARMLALYKGARIYSEPRFVSYDRWQPVSTAKALTNWAQRALDEFNGSPVSQLNVELGENLNALYKTVKARSEPLNSTHCLLDNVGLKLKKICRFTSDTDQLLYALALLEDSVYEATPFEVAVERTDYFLKETQNTVPTELSSEAVIALAELDLQLVLSA